MNKYTKILDNIYTASKEVGHDGICDRSISIKKKLNTIIDPIKYVDNPLSIVWYFSSLDHPSVIKYSLGQLITNVRLLDNDEFLFVVDPLQYNIVESCLLKLEELYKIKVEYKLIKVDRNDLGDTPYLHWQIGVGESEHDRILFIRNNTLFFDLIEKARMMPLENSINNFSTILGFHTNANYPHWGWACHSLFAPSPVLSCWAAPKELLKSCPFDIRYRRGCGYIGDLDFLLRSTELGIEYNIIDDVSVLKLPIIVNSEEQHRDIGVLTSRLLNFFRDKWGAIEQNLKPPFSLDMPLLNVHECEINKPFTIVKWEKNTKDNLPEISEDNLDRIHSLYQIDLNKFILGRNK